MCFSLILIIKEKTSKCTYRKSENRKQHIPIHYSSEGNIILQKQLQCKNKENSSGGTTEVWPATQCQHTFSSRFLGNVKCDHGPGVSGEKFRRLFFFLLPNQCWGRLAVLSECTAICSLLQTSLYNKKIKTCTENLKQGQTIGRTAGDPQWWVCVFLYTLWYCMYSCRQVTGGHWTLLTGRFKVYFCTFIQHYQ